MRRSIFSVGDRATGVWAVPVVTIVAAAILTAIVLAAAGCGTASSHPTSPSAHASATAAAGTFSDPAHAFTLKYDDKLLAAALPADAPWIAQFEKALGAGKTTFVVAFHLPAQGTATPAAGQLPIPVQAVGVTLSNLSADGYKQFVTPVTLRTYAKQVYLQARKYYGPSTQTQLTKVGGYPAISTASYRADKSGRKALIWTVSVFTPRWNYLFYTVADAANAKQVIRAFDAVLRSLQVTK
ncbi:MAG: hypothetical protein WCN81_15440 [Actinomycetes bacterium]